MELLAQESSGAAPGVPSPCWGCAGQEGAAAERVPTVSTALPEREVDASQGSDFSADPAFPCSSLGAFASSVLALPGRLGLAAAARPWVMEWGAIYIASKLLCRQLASQSLCLLPWWPPPTARCLLHAPCSGIPPGLKQAERFSCHSLRDGACCLSPARGPGVGELQVEPVST